MSFLSSGASNSTVNLGTLQIAPILSTAQLPAIVAEWAGLLPLVIHLTSRHFDFQLAGEAALLGRISIGLFPKLGSLQSIARLLEGGEEFLERASIASDTMCGVYDVNWGSTFACANGAASSMVMTWALRRIKTSIIMPDRVEPPVRKTLAESGTQSETTESPPQRGNLPDPEYHRRRFQTLNVLKFRRTITKRNWRNQIDSAMSSWAFVPFASSMLVAGAVVSMLFGCYGTAVILLSGAVSQLACHMLRFERPDKYLVSSENHDACMLLSASENSSTWYLYIGDRGVVDFLLNKTMIEHSSRGGILSLWFRIAHYIQLLAMTFVAAQKGWDGVCMVIVMISAWLFHWPHGRDYMARRWLEHEGITVKAKRFDFVRRSQMIGAIQLFSGRKVTSWMDRILVNCPRRQAWLQALGCLDTANYSSPPPELESLTHFDQSWVRYITAISAKAGEILISELEDLRR
ncbi:hypothetical protein LPUS_07236 [Lasallia pustulata]|uniref:Uncharacterized protein n=1 Tax=Lasallia pustulata TaxID=136370 RepID=A0A1W5D2Q1_9LECA|nr:hypothetical protein LPUS_07236 [Lasallia pustulata]